MEYHGKKKNLFSTLSTMEHLEINLYTIIIVID